MDLSCDEMPAESTCSKNSVSGRKARHLVLCLVLLLFAFYAYSHNGEKSSNSLSRLYLLCAVVSEGTLMIDSYENGTGNIARFEGNVYSDKPPGTAALALPAFIFAHWVCRLHIPKDATTSILALSWVTTAGAVGLLTAIGGAFMLAWLRRWSTDRYALYTTVGVFLGATPMIYSTMLYPHAITAALLSLALWCIDSPSKSPVPPIKAAVSGLSSGLAIACEPSAGVATAGVLCMLLLTDARRSGWWVLGAAFALSLLPAYSFACFGDPFRISYSYSTHANIHEGFFGITTLFQPKRTYELLFGSARGLFFWSPFLLLSVIGFYQLFQRDKLRFAVFYCTVIINVALITGYNFWAAGPSFGSRLLTPVVPFLALPVCLALEKLPRLGFVLIIISVLLVAGGTFINANPGLTMRNPLFEAFLPAVKSGSYTNNIGQVLGLTRHWSFLPLLLVAGPLCYALLTNSRQKENARSPITP
jgi:hypothetical protein